MSKMKIVVLTFGAVGLLLVGWGVFGEQNAESRGVSADVRLGYAMPVFAGAILIAMDVLLIIGWAIWNM